MNDDPSPRRRLRFGACVLDPRTGELLTGGATLRLPPQPARVLALLAGRAGELVTREEMKQEVWGGDTYVEFDQALNFCIRKIRAALGDDAEAPQYIETLARRGYRFIAPVEEEVVPVGAEAAAPAQGLPTSAQAAQGAPVPRVAPAARATGAHASVAAARETAGRIMLAVLPFENLSGDRDQDYLGDGLTEEMIMRLGRIEPRRMGVIARTSAMRYKGAARSIAEIAGELGVQYLLEGSVRMAGGRVRVTAQLIRAGDQTHLWADSYDRPLHDVLALQADVTRAIAGRILERLTPETNTSLPETCSVNPGAYQACLRGRYFWSRRTGKDTRRAITEFEEAIRLDPSCALAFVGLADSYTFLGDVGIVAAPPRDAFAKAAALITRALELEPDLGEAHVSRAHIAMHVFDWAGAERSFERALELAPNYATGHQWYAFFLAFKGRMGAAHAAMARALALDPVSVSIIMDVGELLYFDRHFEEALIQYRRTVDMDPRFLRARIEMGRVLERLGRFDEAIEELRTAVAMSRENPEALATLGHVHAMAGGKREARRILARLQALARSRYVSPYDLAVLYTALGCRDDALRSLESARAEQAAWLIYLNVDPRIDPLRAEPRFRDLERHVAPVRS